MRLSAPHPQAAARTQGQTWKRQRSSSSLHWHANTHQGLGWEDFGSGDRTNLSSKDAIAGNEEPNVLKRRVALAFSIFQKRVVWRGPGSALHTWVRACTAKQCQRSAVVQDDGFPCLRLSRLGFCLKHQIIPECESTG